MRKPISSHLNRISGKIVNAAYLVHKELGPGLLENVYELCLKFELEKIPFKVERQVPVPVKYQDMIFDDAMRIDLLVEDQVVVELKSVALILPVHEAQLLTYLKMTKRQLGLLINFNVPVIKDGIKRMVL